MAGGSADSDGHSIFGVGLFLPVHLVCITFVAVLLFLTCVEMLLHGLELFTGDTVYHSMLQQVYKELMLLGIVAFGLFLLSNISVNLDEQVFLAFEFADITLLFVGCMYVAQAGYVMHSTRAMKQLFQRVWQLAISDLLNDHEQERARLACFVQTGTMQPVPEQAAKAAEEEHKDRINEHDDYDSHADEDTAAAKIEQPGKRKEPTLSADNHRSCKQSDAEASSVPWMCVQYRRVRHWFLARRVAQRQQKEMQLKLLSRLFLEAFHLPRTFNCGAYLVFSLNDWVENLLHISVFSWAGIVCVIMANWVRHILVPGTHRMQWALWFADSVKHDNDSDNSHHHNASASRESMGSDAALFLLAGCVLVVATVILMQLGKLYEFRLLRLAGVHAPSDLAPYLALIEVEDLADDKGLSARDVLLFRGNPALFHSDSCASHSAASSATGSSNCTGTRSTATMSRHDSTGTSSVTDTTEASSVYAGVGRRHSTRSLTTRQHRRHRGQATMADLRTFVSQTSRLNHRSSTLSSINPHHLHRDSRRSSVRHGIGRGSSGGGGATPQKRSHRPPFSGSHQQQQHQHYHHHHHDQQQQQEKPPPQQQQPQKTSQPSQPQLRLQLHDYRGSHGSHYGSYATRRQQGHASVGSGSTPGSPQPASTSTRTPTGDEYMTAKAHLVKRRQSYHQNEVLGLVRQFAKTQPKFALVRSQQPQDVREEESALSDPPMTASTAAATSTGLVAPPAEAPAARDSPAASPAATSRRSTRYSLNVRERDSWWMRGQRMLGRALRGGRVTVHPSPRSSPRISGKDDNSDHSNVQDIGRVRAGAQQAVSEPIVLRIRKRRSTIQRMRVSASWNELVGANELLGMSSSDLETSHDISQIFIGPPALYFGMVKLVMLLNCFYGAIFVSTFASVLPWRTVCILIVPCLLATACLPSIVMSSSMLRAVSCLQTDAVAKAVEQVDEHLQALEAIATRVIERMGEEKSAAHAAKASAAFAAGSRRSRESLRRFDGSPASSPWPIDGGSVSEDSSNDHNDNDGADEDDDDDLAVAHGAADEIDDGVDDEVVEGEDEDSQAAVRASVRREKRASKERAAALWLYELCEEIDAGHTGTLTQQEFCFLARQLGLLVTKQRALALFNEFTQTRVGTVTIDSVVREVFPRVLSEEEVEERLKRVRVQRSAIYSISKQLAARFGSAPSNENRFARGAVQDIVENRGSVRRMLTLPEESSATQATSGAAGAPVAAPILAPAIDI